MIDGSGGLRHISLYATAIFDADKKLQKYRSVVYDITERRQAEQALRESDQRKDEFLAMLAHELRNPLVPISNAAHILGRLEVNEPRIKWAQQVIETQVGLLSHMVDDLLDVSRIAHGKITLKLEEIELTALIKQLMQSIAPLAERKGHQLTIRLPGQEVWLKCDQARLSQILFNLFDNAIKYTPDGGRIELEALAAGQEIKISVRDNGMGIAATLLPKVFNLFQQDERGLDRAQGGLGIGLTLVQRLVDQHGGRVAAYSEGAGLGSTFTIWLPATAMAAKPVVAEVKGKRSAATGARVLVVDDDFAVADSTAKMLEIEGYTVRVVDSGQSALEQVPAFRPQVVLLDIGLKGMNGFETAIRLRELPEGRDLFVVALTGYADEKTRARALASGCDHFLVKPVIFDVLDELLRKMPGAVP
jgi:CheY-like chemotaxis protein